MSHTYPLLENSSGANLSGANGSKSAGSVVLRKDEETSALPTTKMLEKKQTPWMSIWLDVVMQLHIGIQISIYFMSMPVWLTALDSSASMDFVGAVVASASFGCSIMNPVFGYWNQRTMSVVSPVVAGNILMAAGQLLYGLLPLFPADRKWIMLIARFITGCGAGSLSVLKAYAATASTIADRTQVISIGTAGFVFGLACGPAIQAAFTLFENEIFVGPLVLNMYTLPAFSMVAISLGSLVIMVLFFVPNYAGIHHDEDGNPTTIPKYDLGAALVCIYFWVISASVATVVEVISTPVTMAFYDWTDSEAIFRNGVMASLSCILSVGLYFAIGYTRIGKIECRKQMIFGLLCFLLYYVINFSWPFYEGPLNYIPKDENGTEDTTLHGGCYSRFEWCKTAVRVPLPLYIFCFVVVFGISFPFVSTPSHTLFSLILGPRKQGTMQGLMAFGGSFAQFLAPIIATTFFEHFGYLPVVIAVLVEILVALALLAVFYKRLVPLRMPNYTEDLKFEKEKVDPE